jgi:hypothetical protein
MNANFARALASVLRHEGGYISSQNQLLRRLMSLTVTKLMA